MPRPGARVRVLIAKAGDLREDGKKFDAEAMRMVAQERPDQFEYIEATQEIFGFLDLDFNPINGGDKKC